MSKKIEPDRWYRYRYQPSVVAAWDTKVFFRYEVDNRKFSTYSSTIQVSVWRENEKVMDLLAEVAVPRDLFAAILGRITKLGLSPGQAHPRAHRQPGEKDRGSIASFQVESLASADKRGFWGLRCTTRMSRTTAGLREGD